ncbi:MAG: hypothetical protein F4Z02_12570 [Acidimicrobiia bacterium]|nr:hypothetical protein [Acidimicrobiia bacterium]MYG72753.1 hypothetical protein [Acidimicrobiia bacterium]
MSLEPLDRLTQSRLVTMLAASLPNFWWQAMQLRLSNVAIYKLLKENGIPAVAHGFRSSLWDWCAEPGMSRELEEPA